MSDNYVDQGSNTRIAGWHKVSDPATGWFANKTTWSSADDFSVGLTVDFSSAVPVGTKAVRVSLYQATVQGDVYYRKGSDTNISNTPISSQEWSHRILASDNGPCVIWLSATYTADFTVGNTSTDLYVAYPTEYLL